MAAEDSREVEQATIVPMTEEAMAATRREEGFKTVRCRSRYWESVHHGFYQTIHSLSRLTANEIRRPSFLCWGFRTTLDESAADFANGSLPLHLLANVSQFDMDALPGKRRTDLRKCRKVVRIVQLLSPDVLLAQGYPIVQSALQRTGYDYGNYLSEQRYPDFVRRIVTDPSYVVLAGFVGEELAGFLIGYAVGAAAYFKNVLVSSEFKSTAIGTGLVFDFVQVCRQSGRVREICYGQETPEDARLSEYKTGMGFPVVRVPTRVWLPTPINQIIRWKVPHKYYRLTGMQA